MTGAARLRAAGHRVAVLDLTAIGQNLSRAGNPPAGNPNTPIPENRIPEYPPLVLFLDEIDAVRNLPFPADELFAGIRALYNERPDQPAVGQPALFHAGRPQVRGDLSQRPLPDLRRAHGPADGGLAGGGSRGDRAPRQVKWEGRSQRSDRYVPAFGELHVQLTSVQEQRAEQRTGTRRQYLDVQC